MTCLLFCTKVAAGSQPALVKAFALLSCSDAQQSRRRLLVASIIMLGSLANALLFVMYSSASLHLVQVLRCSSPVFAAVLAWWLFKERFTTKAIIGLVCAVFGVAIATWNVSHH
jgi:drug/metabolite transporter (DMT)-like permease